MDNNNNLIEYLLSLPLFSISILFITTLFISLKTLRKKLWKFPELPPGPSKLPIIGSIPYLVGRILPHRRLRELSQKYGPLMYIQMGQVSTVVVSSSKMAKEIYKTHDSVFGDRPHVPLHDLFLYGPCDIIFSPMGHHWKLLRKICSQELLTALRVRSLQPVWEKEVATLMKSVSKAAEKGSLVNIREGTFVTTLRITSRSAFGYKHENQVEAMREIFEKMFHAAPQIQISHLFPSWKWLHKISGGTTKFVDLHRTADSMLEKIIAQESGDNNNEEQGQTLLSTLLKMKRHGDLTINHVKAVMLDVIIAGSESPPVVVEWAMAEMLRKPKIMKRAQAEVREVVFKSSNKNNNERIDETVIEKLEYMKAVVKETMRLHPPSPFLAPRESTEKCEINGYTIPSRTQVIVNAWAIARDPKDWGNSSEEFLPERFLKSAIDYKGFNFEFIPFGGGKRVCPGIMFGVGSVEMILANLLCYFDWELPKETANSTPESLDMSEIMDSTLRKKETMILVPIPYKHVA